jgi:hypothetical protein
MKFFLYKFSTITGSTGRLLKLAACVVLFAACKAAVDPGPVLPPPEEPPVQENDNYPGVLQSEIYEVTLIQNGTRKKLSVFQNSCPEYQLGYMNMTETDQYPLNIFKGRSISWTNFSLKDGTAMVEVKVINKTKVPLSSNVKILPSRYGIVPAVEGDIVRFSLNKPGQCSIEIGENGYKNGLMIFADPAETDKPDTTAGSFFVLKNADQPKVNEVPVSFSGLYFRSGVHNIGVYKIPVHIKNIYFESGSWVYGSLIMDGNPNVKIYGRGVLSSAKLNYRESHAIEAINGSDNIHVEGITVADGKYFTVRLIGKNNTVKWIKVVGGWTYNLDGISAFEGSTVSNCFVWANDDNIKVYRNNITFKDMVCWQLNNGGLIQLSWGNGKADNVTISRVDVLHAEWNNQEVNRGILSCVGDKFAEGGMSGWQKNFLIEDLVTETPVSLIFRVSPNAASPNEIHGMTFKNWNIKMDMGKGFNNYLVCNEPQKPFDGLMFDNFLLNGVKLTASNWMQEGRFQTKNIVAPEFR